MTHQDLKALSAVAVKRAVAAREKAVTVLSSQQLNSVAGGLAAAGGLPTGGSLVLRDPIWYGIIRDPRIPIGGGLAQTTIPAADLDAGIASGKLAV